MLAALLRDADDGIAAPIWFEPPTVPTHVDVDFVVLDIENLSRAPLAMRRAQFHNVLGHAWDIIRADRSERKLLVVDEPWSSVDPKTPETLSFLRSIAKLIRGYNGALLLITQQVNDFLIEKGCGVRAKPSLATAPILCSFTKTTGTIWMR